MVIYIFVYFSIRTTIEQNNPLLIKRYFLHNYITLWFPVGELSLSSYHLKIILQHACVYFDKLLVYINTSIPWSLKSVIQKQFITVQCESSKGLSWNNFDAVESIKKYMIPFKVARWSSQEFYVFTYRKVRNIKIYPPSVWNIFRYN